jgi:hypothetical protein
MRCDAFVCFGRMKRVVLRSFGSSIDVFPLIWVMFVVTFFCAVGVGMGAVVAWTGSSRMPSRMRQ